jgi:hypothetical protein
VLKLERKWLEPVPWRVVVSVNQELCQKDHQEHNANLPGYERAQQLWEETLPRTMNLRTVLDVYRQTHKLAPFKFFNGNTVAAVAERMMGPVLEGVPSVQAAMARKTVAHYVVGAIRSSELEAVLEHVAQVWRKVGNGNGSQPRPAPRA